MAVGNAFTTEIQNRNFLSPVGFKFTLNRSPKVAFFSNSANIPGLTLGIANQPSYLKDIETPGDKIAFNDLSIRFLVDENLENYMEIQNWIRGLGFPYSLDEIYDLQKQQTYVDTSDTKLMNIFSDGTLHILTSSNTPNFKLKFRDLWPYQISDLQFDATDTDVEYLTAEVSFKYTIYDITDLNGNKL
jgi:hypothetical protein